MYFDLDDHRPEVPRVPDVISRREGVLLSLVVHGGLALLVLFPPFTFPKEKPDPTRVTPQDVIRYVQMTPRVDPPAIAVRPSESSDRDRSSKTREKAPDAANTNPLSRGESPERVDGGKTVEEKTNGGETPPVPALADKGAKATPDAPPVPAPADLRGSLKNLQRYLDDQSFRNPRGGMTEQDPDIQFDSKGVDFGPWLRRFVAQVKRNWLIPLNAMSESGRVVITFYVMRDGSIRDLKIIRPSSITSFNNAAFDALRLSNPTVPLPPEYPSDRAFFTVTFHYNDGSR
jgi:TonB family protein